MDRERNPGNFWDTLTHYKQIKAMTGIDPLAPPGGHRDYIGELASAKVVDLRKLPPREKAEYFLTCAAAFK